MRHTGKTSSLNFTDSKGWLSKRQLLPSHRRALECILAPKLTHPSLMGEALALVSSQATTTHECSSICQMSFQESRVPATLTLTAFRFLLKRQITMNSSRSQSRMKSHSTGDYFKRCRMHRTQANPNLSLAPSRSIWESLATTALIQAMGIRPKSITPLLCQCRRGRASESHRLLTLSTIVSPVTFLKFLRARWWTFKTTWTPAQCHLNSTKTQVSRWPILSLECSLNLKLTELSRILAIKAKSFQWIINSSLAIFSSNVLTIDEKEKSCRKCAKKWSLKRWQATRLSKRWCSRCRSSMSATEICAQSTNLSSKRKT